MIMCIDGDRSYMISGLFGRGDKRVPGKEYAEWHGCRAALLYNGNPWTPSRYVVSGSDREQCLAVAKHFKLDWTTTMWEGQYGPCYDISKEEAEEASKILGGISTAGCWLR